ncbi:MAG: metal-sulfur cluster assembly factor [Thermoprotei archaeon]
MATQISKEDILEAFKSIVDPELGLNIVDLGIIYDINIDGSKVIVKMTLTTPRCPFSFIIFKQVRDTLKKLGFTDIKVNIVFDPPWNPSMINPVTRNKIHSSPWTKY